LFALSGVMHIFLFNLESNPMKILIVINSIISLSLVIMLTDNRYCTDYDGPELYILTQKK
jgi:hypothetical protein